MQIIFNRKTLNILSYLILWSKSLITLVGVSQPLYEPNLPYNLNLLPNKPNQSSAPASFSCFLSFHDNLLHSNSSVKFKIKKKRKFKY